MPPHVSTAEAYFNDLLGGDRVVALRGLVRVVDPEFETEWLDFKGDPRPGDELEIWSKALAGFANTEGGVLIWGIDAREDKTTGIDAANGFRLVPQPLVLKSRLQELVNRSTDPPVQGVRIEAVVDPSTGGPGFVVCYIPESSNKPHRAESVAGKPYVIRAGTSFVNPSPALLRSLFYPRLNSRLWIETAPSWEKPSEQLPLIDVSVELRIHNDGPASAREIRLLLPGDGWRMGNVGDYWRVSDSEFAGFAFEYLQSVHPGQVKRICILRKQLRAATVFAGDQSWSEPHEEISLPIAIYAQDRESQIVDVAFSIDDLVMMRSVKGVTR